jgi:hypothetical protein
MKFRDCSEEGQCGLIQDVTFQNIRIVRPTQVEDRGMGEVVAD